MHLCHSETSKRAAERITIGANFYTVFPRDLDTAYRLGGASVPILQMRSLRHRGVKVFFCGLTCGK